jgi:hypothetical protein
MISFLHISYDAALWHDTINVVDLLRPMLVARAAAASCKFREFERLLAPLSSRNPQQLLKLKSDSSDMLMADISIADASERVGVGFVLTTT